MEPETKVLKLFYEWSNETTKKLEDENDIKAVEFLWDIEKLINKHVDKCLQKYDKNRLQKNKSEINALLIAEKKADEIVKEAETLYEDENENENWTILTSEQLFEIEEGKRTVAVIENIHKKADIMM